MFDKLGPRRTTWRPERCWAFWGPRVAHEGSSWTPILRYPSMERFGDHSETDCLRKEVSPDPGTTAYPVYTCG